MLSQLHDLLEVFKEAPPGERFQRLYWRRESRQSSVVARSFFLGAGLTIMALGLVLLPAPGPGTLVLLFGGAIAAQESLRVARAMDWCEARARGGLGRVVEWWRNRSLSVKGLIVAATAGSAASVGLAGYRLIAAVYADGF